MSSTFAMSDGAWAPRRHSLTEVSDTWMAPPAGSLIVLCGPSLRPHTSASNASLEKRYVFPSSTYDVLSMGLLSDLASMLGRCTAQEMGERRASGGRDRCGFTISAGNGSS